MREYRQTFINSLPQFIIRLFDKIVVGLAQKNMKKFLFPNGIYLESQFLCRTGALTQRGLFFKKDA